MDPTPGVDSLTDIGIEKTLLIDDKTSPVFKPPHSEAGSSAMTKTPPSIRSSPGASLRTQSSFKEEHTVGLFHLHSRHDKLKLTAVRCPGEVGRTNHPNYCLFHRMIGSLTKISRTLKIILQALINAGVLKLHSEQKAAAL